MPSNQDGSSSDLDSRTVLPTSLGLEDPAAAELPPSSSDRLESSSTNYQDIDSEELEALEDEADDDEEDDETIIKLLDQAAEQYPPELVSTMIRELKEDGMVNFLQKYVVQRHCSIKKLLIALGVLLPRSIRDAEVPESSLLPILKTALSRILRRREKLPQYNTVDDAIQLIKNSKKIIVLSGAGISVSCGIPDFRSKDGIYANLQREGKFELDDPQDMFDKEFFMHNPSCFYSFAHSIFPSNFKPSPSHRFIKLLEERSQLLRNYSQNIDTLEQACGIENVLQCHGSFATATCTDPSCSFKAPGSSIRQAIFDRTVPLCPRCKERDERRKTGKKGKPVGARSSWKAGDDSDEEDEGPELAYGVMKPDITFFGEKLSDEFDHKLLQDRSEVDLLIVMGTSLKVAPVSELVAHIPHKTPTILINRTPILHMQMDIMLLGDSDEVVKYICEALAWKLPKPRMSHLVGGVPNGEEGEEGQDKDDSPAPDHGHLEPPQRIGQSHAWLFKGAEPGRLLEMLNDPSNGTDEEEEEEGGNDRSSSPVGEVQGEGVEGDEEGDKGEKKRGGERNGASRDSESDPHQQPQPPKRSRVV
ncbi:SIR2-domain-containing protein [Violaceomyces palustris]|uniref:SIR2-domain-containing protein n=1 Tax=Violaceomyces palustris TaxID=1673888 RepID=A0ACD0P5Q9_9BASI|nr:SIR2-domain-containing protein [Violaceomyces palustris]